MGDVVTYAVLLGWLGFVFFPLYWIFTMSFKSEVDIITMPPKLTGWEPTLDNFLTVLNIERRGISANTGAPVSDFPAYMLNSVILVGGGIIITAVVGLMAAYAVSRYRFLGRNVISILILFTQMIPGLTILMPLYVLYRQVGLYNTYAGVIIAYQLYSLPYFIWLLRSHISAIPIELEDAARVDGCNLFQILRNVVLPLLTPGLVSSGILVFIGMWNSFIAAMLLGGPKMQPVTVGILNYSGYDNIQWGRTAAASVICIIPEIIAGMWIQQYIVKGLSAGSVKG
jgi:multiple sugar transport system permease protein